MSDRLSRNDLIQLVIGLAFATTAFLPWYGTDPGNPASNIDGERGELSAWDVHPTLRWLILFVGVAALLSAWQTWHSHRTEWKRGEMSVVVASTAAGLVLVAGLLARPGEPSGTISLEYGWFVALAISAAGIAVALSRMPQARRRPPGV
jgi:hypothetical protein